MNALESLLGSIKEELGDEGIGALKSMCDTSEEQEYQEFADEMIKSEKEKPMTSEEIANKALKMIKRE